MMDVQKINGNLISNLWCKYVSGLHPFILYKTSIIYRRLKNGNTYRAFSPKKFILTESIGFRCTISYADTDTYRGFTPLLCKYCF